MERLGWPTAAVLIVALVGVFTLAALGVLSGDDVAKVLLTIGGYSGRVAHEAITAKIAKSPEDETP